jgi:Asp-tRNA(Asn)/Glu-tRNA(Gln) amidotransferase A subunit family amidase
MIDELSRLDATGQAELVHRGEVTAVELVEAAIARVEALNPVLNAAVTASPHRPLTQGRVIWGVFLADQGGKSSPARPWLTAWPRREDVSCW